MAKRSDSVVVIYSFEHLYIKISIVTSFLKSLSTLIKSFILHVLYKAEGEERNPDPKSFQNSNLD